MFAQLPNRRLFQTLRLGNQIPNKQTPAWSSVGGISTPWTPQMATRSPAFHDRSAYECMCSMGSQCLARIQPYGPLYFEIPASNEWDLSSLWLFFPSSLRFRLSSGEGAPPSSSAALKPV
ncbi:hypothetical protein PAXRUDRAFT_565182 [Paxillus rubicundulus Ve08.2h10]|uniref:Uncharacterized protein n=1 Tax=Paxillus rubicundulus Ve08.2h10 TaxID=930991 RepID=A0A0D0DVX6_9AGAM|nr:hypothetical protein PAXRUDRAFT_565182 [Paxillus rubicundulus Ve08.2h10]